MTALDLPIRTALRRGTVIPASPLALDSQRRLDEVRQRALWRYYSAAGAGGIAVAVHTTQFAIRDPKIGLFQPLLDLARDELNRIDVGRSVPVIRVAGVCGATEQAVAEATLAREHGFHAGLVSLAAMSGASLDQLLTHCQLVAEVLPVFGFYLQPAVGGVLLPYDFWRRFFDIPGVVAVKVAPFNRYQTLDVMRAAAESERDDVALYTGNDDNIVLDLVTNYRFEVNGAPVERRFVGGLLGHWACWTRRAVELLEWCHRQAEAGAELSPEVLQRNVEVTDANAALFDVAHGFAGCIPGVHEVLRRQGLLLGTWCLDPEEQLSPGQSEELNRITRSYPHLIDDEFVAAHLDEWLG
jgi:dihydrodipicolinate synthase/N-acetylneuraminate lyase